VSVCLFFRFLSTFCPDLSVVWRNPVLLAREEQERLLQLLETGSLTPSFSLALPVNVPFSHPSDQKHRSDEEQKDLAMISVRW